MYFLCTVTTAALAQMYGSPEMPGQPAKAPTVDFKLVFIAQATPVCLSYLVLSQNEHPSLIRQTSIPTGYEFIFRQSWGMALNEEVLHRVVQTLRAEAYPPIADYLDAKVKSDAAQEAAYIAACQAVKAQHPKFTF